MSDLPGRADVVIVGGGIIGTALAHHLGRLGARDVLLLERERLLGTGSTGASAGGLRQQFEKEHDVLFAMEGVRQILRLEEETGVDPDFRRHGYFLLAGTEETRERLLADIALQNRLGLPAVFLAPREIATRYPVLRTEDLAGAAFCPTDGYCDPHRILQAFRASAKGAGIRIETGVEVRGFLRDGPRVTGVRTDRGDVRAAYVVNAAGPWGGDLARLAGLPLPLRTCRRQIFATHPCDVPGDLPLVIDLDHPFYFRPEVGGVILSAAEVEETRNYDLEVDETGLPELVERAVHRCPALAEARIARGWAGLRTLTPDGSAILGDAPDVPGLLLALGMSGHGITHAPAVGLALAERIVHGESRTLPLHPFRADRFDGNAGPGAGGVIC